MSTDVTEKAVNCTECDKRIEECACCEEPECGAAICYGCLNAAVGQQRPQVRADGG